VKRIISASRRTDLVAHYPDLLADRIGEIGAESIHTLVIWTKDPRNLLQHRRLRATLGAVGQIYLHWTITGLGGTFLEPRIRPPGLQAPMLTEVINLVGSPKRMAWRYDPLITASRNGETAGNVSIECFRPLAQAFAAQGVARVHTSFVCLYAKVRRRAARERVEIVEYPPEERDAFLRRLREEAARFGLEVIACCEPGQPRGACVNGALLASLHSAGEPCSTRRAGDQRLLCGCTESLDIGQYLRCPSGCLYCYGSPACNAGDFSGV